MCFSPPRRKRFTSLSQANSPVKIKKFHIDTKSNAEDLLMCHDVTIEHFPAIDFDKVKRPTMMNLSAIKSVCPGQIVTVTAKVTHLYLRNRKHVPCFYRVIQTRVEVWENEKCCGNTSRRRVFPQLFRVLPNFHECLYNSIEIRSTCFRLLLENNATKKRKTTC